MSSVRRPARPLRARPALPLFLILPGRAAAQARPATSAPAATTASLRSGLDRIVAAHHGVVGYSIHDLDTGAELALRGDETFPTASLSKVPILSDIWTAFAPRE